MTDMTATTDWRALLDSWDRQQTGYIPQREHLFATMLDAAQRVVGDRPLVLDLACGPGAISQRLLARLPGARSVAVDIDPVLMAVGQGALGTVDGRLRWVDQDLREEGWTEALGDEPFDAVMSTTALHWLTPEMLTSTYRQLAGILRPGGILLNGDHLQFDDRSPVCRQVTSAIAEARQQEAFAHADVDDWAAWWASLDDIPGMAELAAERARRFAHREDEPPRTFGCPSLAFHVGALAEAGFKEMDTIWQDLDHRILLAVR